MIARPAGAAGATAAAAAAPCTAPAESGKGADANPAGPTAGAEPASFVLALLALAAAPESGGIPLPAQGPADANAADAAAAAGAPADTAGDFSLASLALAADRAPAGRSSVSAGPAPVATDANLPPDPLRSLYTSGAMPSALIGAGRRGTDGSADGADSVPAPGSAGKAGRCAGKRAAKPIHEMPQATAAITTAAPDPGAALLATVLQWLRQPRDAAGAVSAAATAPAVGAVAIDAAPIGATAIKAAVIDTAPILRASRGGNAARAGVAPGVETRDSAVAPEAPPAATAPGFAAAGVPVPDFAAAGRNPADPLAAQRVSTPQAAPVGLAQIPSPAADDGEGADAATAASATQIAGRMDMAAALHAASAVAAAPAERSVSVPVQERHWPTALAAQVLLISNDKVQAATLRLTPEHLGPLEVRIDMRDAQVSVNFTAAHAETRAALEQAMPQLRAVLEGAGLTLGQATVQQQARRESQYPGATVRHVGGADEPPETVAAIPRSMGMVDEFA